MKPKYLAIYTMFVCTALMAQEKRERTLLTTDRSYYAAGEEIRCSAFCLEDEGRFSNLSSVAYIEVYGTEGTVARGKTALIRGRGGCSIEIPSDVPTGNYRIAAYTSSNKNEEGYDYNCTSKIISIYNTTSTAREKDGVKAVDGIHGALSENVAAPHNSTFLKIERGDTEYGFVPIGIKCGQDATVSVSVWHDESFPNYDASSLGAIAKKAWEQATTYKYKVPAEYDGEIIYARITGNPDTTALFLSSPGSRSDIYKGHQTKDGRTAFFTDNIYGDKDVAIISMSDKSGSFDVELDSPYEGIKPMHIPSLEISKSLSESLMSLDSKFRVTKAFDADTLYEALKFRKLDLLGKYQNRYVMDDYTRFVTMREVFIEFLHDIHVERENGKIFLNVKTLDTRGMVSFKHSANSLILLDGVPVTDHSVIYEMDPLLVKYVEIYPNNYGFGTSYFSGAANFVTYKENLSGVKLGIGSRILSFKGVSVPTVYSAKAAAYDPDFPAMSETLYWHPLAKIETGKTLEINIVEPGYKGTFIVTVEGFLSDGTPLFYQESFKL